MSIDELAAMMVTDAELAAMTVTDAEFAAMAVTDAELAAMTVTDAEFAAMTVTDAELAAMTLPLPQVKTFQPWEPGPVRAFKRKIAKLNTKSPNDTKAPR